jgi:hypothetical protein
MTFGKSLLSKMILTQTIECENRTSPPCHAREGGHPVVLSLSKMTWIPAGVYPALDAGRE